jgi:hypothetical protein
MSLMPADRSAQERMNYKPLSRKKVGDGGCQTRSRSADRGPNRSALPSTLICGKIILGQRNLVPESDNLQGCRDEGGPVFVAEAAFALAVCLSEQGHFTHCVI